MTIDFRLNPDCLKIIDYTKPMYPGSFVGGFEVWLVEPQLDNDILVATCETHDEAERVIADFRKMWDQLHGKRN